MYAIELFMNFSFVCQTYAGILLETSQFETYK